MPNHQHDTLTTENTFALTARPRRLRLNPTLRRMVRETTLRPDDLIYPIFVQEGLTGRAPISAMPGQARLGLDTLADEARELKALGIPAVILFGIPTHKDGVGSENFNPDGIMPQAIQRIKDAAPELVVITDMCCCEYTSHGHCGIVNQPDHAHYNFRLPTGYLLNDATLEILQRASIVHAQAGADIIAPSGMVDGMVAAIRAGLDGAGFEHTTILSYAVKTASGFYNPFREAVDSAPEFGDRQQYQMDFANKREALREAALDVEQGADMLMVKPALVNLDILSAVRETFGLPTAAYQVSGEYAMLHAAAGQGWLDLRRTALETLLSIKRAGADLILTYFAKDAVKWLG
jgi:porphobilinogen synthase